MARASPKMKANLKTLMDERDRLIDQAEALKHKIEGLELAISLLGRDDSQPGTDTSKRGNAKTLLLDLLREAGTTGLTSISAVEIAARRGVKLERGTAASNLSRMKADGIVVYDGDRYRLVEFSRPRIIGQSGGFSSSRPSHVATVLANLEDKGS